MSAPQPTKNLVVVLEGLKGAGKTTLAHQLTSPSAVVDSSDFRRYWTSAGTKRMLATHPTLVICTESYALLKQDAKFKALMKNKKITIRHWWITKSK